MNETMAPQRVGVVGLGKMGLPMARHLVAGGFTVVGYDPEEARRTEAANAGVTIAASPKQVAAETDGTLVVVGFDDQAAEVCGGGDGIRAGAARGHTVLICSTIRPTTSVAIAEELADAGIRVADATLCRAEHAAVDATLLVMFGGDEDVLEAWRGALGCFASDIARVGDVGAGQIAKMINNVLLWISVVGNQEALRLARELGMEQGPLVDALLLSSGANWAMETWQKARPMPWAEDDLGICLDIATEHGFPMPLTASVREAMKDVKRRKAARVEGGAKASMYAYVEQIGLD